MRRQYCPSASLFQRFSHRLGNQARAILILVLLVSLTRPALREAYADGEVLYVRTVLAALRAAKDDLVAVKPLISSNPFNADRLEINNQIKKLKAAEDGLCLSFPEECHPDADDLAKPPVLTVGITDPNVVNANDAAKAGQEILKKYQNLSGISSDKRAAIDQNLGLLQDVTTCKITITQPSGVVTAFTSDKNPLLNITANIPLASDAPVKILLDGAEVGSLFPKGTIWGSSQFHLDGTGKTADTTSVITVTGTAGNPPAVCTSTNAVTVNWKAPPKPVIKSFTAKPDKVNQFDPLKKWTSFSWETTDADTTSIDQGVGAVAPAKSGTKLFDQTQHNTTYTLTAKGPGGEVTSDPVTVNVKPVITSFGANPPQIELGKSSTLIWSIDDADRAGITPGVGGVNPQTSGNGLPVSPQQDTTYTLEASGPGGEADPRSVTVRVKPVITSFTANPDEIAPGQSSTLSWTISGATSASIDQGVGAVNAQSGSTTVSPQQKTTYTLTASGPAGTSAEPKSVTVRVESQPQTYTITLASSGGGNLATTEQVTVDGTVTPVPPAGTVVALGVNGTPVGTVNVDSSGFFVAVVPLQNKTTLNDLVLFNYDVEVTSCGAAASPVDLWNSTTQAQVQNFIEAAVVAPGGGAASNTASVVIYHGVRVIDAEVVWGGECPGPYRDFGGGAVLGPGYFVTVAEAECGVPCPPPPDGVFCTATATAYVTTTVGELPPESGFWIVDVPPP